MNILDWAIKVVGEVMTNVGKFPNENERDAWRSNLAKLRALRQEVFGERVLICPNPDCSFLCIGLTEGPPEVHKCPKHDAVLEPTTWKYVAQGLLGAVRDKVRETDGKLDEVRFLAANEEEELEYLRAIHNSTIGQFAGRMAHELRVNERKGDWEQWKPGIDELLSEFTHHLDKLKIAFARNNQYAITEYCADLGNYAMKTAELYGR